MELTDRQTDVLECIVSHYQSEESPISGDDIADAVGCHPGTVRSDLQGLSALDLVEGITGPKGGYKPTAEAYRALDDQSRDGTADLTLAHDYARTDVTVTEIDFTAVNHPEQCRARVAFADSIDEFGTGDPILVGPTPKTGLVVGGEIEAIDHEANELELDVGRLEAPLTS